MIERWVANASPLILLGKIDRLDLLRDLATDLVIPVGVVGEVAARAKGRRSLDDLAFWPDVHVQNCDSIPRDIAVWDLGRGESEVLALAIQEEASRVVVDDLEARRCAQALGVGVIGTLGVVLRARRAGLIPAARPVVTRLREVGLYLSDNLTEQALAYLGE